MRDEVAKKYPVFTFAKLSNQSGQVNRFVNEMQVGDIVLSPKGEGRYAIGRISGDYHYDNKPSDKCPYKHRRKVEWQDEVLNKDDMSSSLSYSLGAIMTIFSLNKHADELDLLVKRGGISPAEKPEGIRDNIINGLYELDGKEFEEFVRDLLITIGFEAEATQYVGDKGIDVNGVLDAQGVADIILRVQVKRVKGTISNKEILAMRGTLAQGEHGCFITLSGFTKQAIEEAEADGKTAIKLVDGNDLATLVLRNYDEIDDKYKDLFGIKRKKVVDWEKDFELMDGEIIEEEIEEERADEKKKDFDTLLCAAKEEGFKRAFLGEKAWWAVRIRRENIPLIKYLAIYQVAPISAITHYAKVVKIEPFGDTGKYKLFLKNITKMSKKVGIGKNKYLKPQGPRYIEMSMLKKAKSLDDLF